MPLRSLAKKKGRKATKGGVIPTVGSYHIFQKEREEGNQKGKSLKEVCPSVLSFLPKRKRGRQPKGGGTQGKLLTYIISCNINYIFR
jgi:hypothetical protein